MIITQILARNARMYPHDIALVEREPEKNRRTEMNWLQFHRQANRVANALMASGVKKGDRVAHLMMNGIEWLPIYFGILASGAMAAPMNFRFTAKDIRTANTIVGARVLVFGPEFIDRLGEVVEELSATIRTFVFVGEKSACPDFAVCLSDFTAGVSDTAPGVPLDLSDPAGLYFTSGTTGTPKCATITHRNLEFACYLENRHHNQTKKDNFLCIPPLYHTGAKMHWFGNFVVGAPSVLLKGVTPEWILEAVSEEGITVVWLLVPWALDILFAVESGEIKLKNYQLDQWRLMHIGAQPVPQSLIREWKSVFPNHQYDTNYGLTETTGPGCVHLGLENEYKVGAIGLPGFDWEYRVVDPHQVDVPPGEPGELWVRGPGIMSGYYGNPEATNQVLINGWLTTGDIARVDKEGFIWLVDRKKDVIITGGENIYPVEIENFLAGHPKIADVAVIGLPSLRLGEIPAAIIKVKGGKILTKEELTQFCEDLPRYKRPRRFFFGDVPRNPTGKIEKPKLREQYAGMQESFRI